MKCSIIIPHRNQHTQLKKCIDELEKYNYHNSCEIIVVDNGSEDKITFLTDKIKLLHTRDVKSPYIARNKGIEASQNEIILLLDVNCIVKKDFVEQLKAEYDENTIIAGQYSHENLTDLSVFQKFDFLYSTPLKTSIPDPSALPATSLFFNKKVIDDIGYFPEQRSLSDMKWTALANAAGYQLKYAHEAKFSYPYKNKNQFKKKYQRLGKGMIVHKNYRNKYPYTLKQFLPPSPRFVINMKKHNDDSRLDLGWLQIVYLCYVVKINYGIGAIKAIFD